MDNYFNNKVAWITGASSGIGEEVAYALSAVGARLILSARRMDELERVKQACSNPAQVQILQLDLADTASAESKVAEAIDCFGHIDLMFHNGGITQRSLVAESDMGLYRRIMEVDYFSYVALTLALLPHFTARKAGHFVVTSSVMGKIGTPLRSGYASAKHALHGFFDCLRSEVLADNIKVTLILPGYISTNISLYALTNKPYGLAQHTDEITNGMPSNIAAKQILKAVKQGKFEAYVGRIGSEKLALVVKRLSPVMFTRLIAKYGWP